MHRAQRLSLLLTLFCALFLRVAVPVRWMPEPQAGAFAIVPCPAADAQPMAMPTGSHSAGDHAPHKDQHSGDCSFSPFHAGFTSAAALAPIPPAVVNAANPRAHVSLPVRATGPPAPPPPSTGPPVLA